LIFQVQGVEPGHVQGAFIDQDLDIPVIPSMEGAAAPLSFVEGLSAPGEIDTTSNDPSSDAAVTEHRPPLMQEPALVMEPTPMPSPESTVTPEADPGIESPYSRPVS
jgi:hypothetical protein